MVDLKNNYLHISQFCGSETDSTQLRDSSVLRGFTAFTQRQIAGGQAGVRDQGWHHSCVWPLTGMLEVWAHLGMEMATPTCDLSSMAFSEWIWQQLHMTSPAWQSQSGYGNSCTWPPQHGSLRVDMTTATHDLASMAVSGYWHFLGLSWGLQCRCCKTADVALLMCILNSQKASSSSFQWRRESPRLDRVIYPWQD